MRNKIRRNLFLSVDYEKEKTKAGIFTGEKKIYLIGSLPVVVFYKDGKKEITKLKSKIEIPGNDPALKNILGIKATDEKRSKRYKHEINTLTERFNRLIKKLSEAKKLSDKPVKSLAIINF